MKIYQHRFYKAQVLLSEQEIDALVVTAPANFFYFTGIPLDSQERLQAIVIPRTGTPSAIVHEMLAVQLSVPGEVEKIIWQDGEPAIKLLASILPAKGNVAIDNQWPSGNLIQLMKYSTLTFCTGDKIIGKLRLFKDEHEVKLLKASGLVADQVMGNIIKYLKTGMTEKDLAAEIKKQFKKHGANQLSFDPIVAFGSNSAIPHHVSGDTKLHIGDVVLIDMGGVKDGYCSDISRTFVFGEPTPEISKVYNTVKYAQNEAVKAIKPGILMEHIDHVARTVINKAGYGKHFTHRTGHGVGIDVHEQPFLTPGNDQPLEEGMVVSVEPGIYLPEEFGVRIEDIVVVTASGAERLNNFNRDLTMIDANNN